jgi:hypothetical protein
VTERERGSGAASDADAAARRRRRAVLRAHHPDLGGDPEELIRQLASLDAATKRVTAEPVTFVRRPRGLRRLAYLLRRSRRRRAARPRVR